ncbi:MAG: class I SAM-dependent methyltransferase [Candidatus Kapaibacterium sp.]
MKVTERFSNRVENYVKFRPHYPSEIIPFLSEEIGLSPSSVIADIGSGTGISARMFLKNGNTVYGIEPNKEMREAGETFLKEYPKFHSIDGTAEATTLKDASIDCIIAGQAFHWFDVAKATVEFKRILKPGGWVVLIWNERILDATPFLISYENLLHSFGTDYAAVQHTNVKGNISSLFKDKGYTVKIFPNSQSCDLEALQGRLLSSSYIPTADSPKYRPMLEELREMFDRYQVDGRIDILYNTEVFFGQLH